MEFVMVDWVNSEGGEGEEKVCKVDWEECELVTGI